MGATPTTIPTITAAQFAARLAANFPPGWASPEAKNSAGGALHNLLLMFGAPLAFVDGALQYAANATRIPTAQDTALDLASLDFFGSGSYAIPRNSGESDAGYRTRLLAAMLPPGATRPAMFSTLQAITGYAPRLIELWRPFDTGVIDGVGGPAAAGVGTQYWDVDTVVTPGRWADPGLRYQALIECVLPLTQPFGNNPTPAWDNFNSYWDTPGSAFIDSPPVAVGGEQLIYDAINRVKCLGTVCWVRFVPPPSPFNFDQPGLFWDESGVVWS